MSSFLDTLKLTNANDDENNDNAMSTAYNAGLVDDLPVSDG